MRTERFRRFHPSATMTFNATPMVDVIFLLVIFFMLVSRFSSAEQVPLQLPKPAGSQARTARIPDRVIVNCRLADPQRPDGVVYSIGPNRPESLEVISRRLGSLKRKAPTLKVIVRADRRLPYADVRAVMEVIAEHQIAVLNVVAHVAEKE